MGEAQPKSPFWPESDVEVTIPYVDAGEEKEQDTLNKSEFPYSDEKDEGLFEFPDPGNFDGDYGPGSYYEHAMRKDD